MASDISSLDTKQQNMAKRQKIEDNKLFELLNFTKDDREGNKKKEIVLDVDAIMKEVRRNPESTEKKYSFLIDRNSLISPGDRYPLQQAIMLKAPLRVVKALCSSSAGKITDLHLALHCGAPPNVICHLLDEWPAAIQEKDGSMGNTPLHWACEENQPLEVVSLLLDKWPDGLWRYNYHGCTPLHCACRSRGGPSLDVLSLLVEGWPGALKATDNEYNLPLHLACKKHASSDVISLLLRGWPDALKEKNESGLLPLRCFFEVHFVNAQWESVPLLVNGWPDAVRAFEWCTVLHCACAKRAPLWVLVLLLESWPEATLVERKYDRITALRLTRGMYPRKVLFYITQLCKNRLDQSSSKEAIEFFVSIEWWNGIILILDRQPQIVQRLEIGVKLCPYFFSLIGRRCKMKTLWHMIGNMQDILADVKR